MVAKITFPKRVAAALNYNENKVAKGRAILLHSSGFLKEGNEISFYDKLKAFERLNDLNERASTKTIHVSLNFGPSEKLANGKLIEIANFYMEMIGFGDQPYLTYRHEDAGHPHIHIVSSTIRDDGSRINTHNIGRNASEKARREIEQLYGLIEAEKQGKMIGPRIKAIELEKVVYGKAETKRGISNIVSAVFSQYKFTSLPEFNAALRQFNVVADRGKEEGRIYRNRGLVYRILDGEGAKIGVPIKGSSLACQPILGNLEKKFTANEVLREPLKQRLKSALDHSVLGAHTMQELITSLGKKEVYVLPRLNSEGRLYGITFVDNKTKSVFNGSDLGKQYSAVAIQSRLSTSSNEHAIGLAANTKDATSSNAPQKELNLHQIGKKAFTADTKSDSLLDALLTVKEQNDNVPSSLLKKKRRKKKRNDPNF